MFQYDVFLHSHDLFWFITLILFALVLVFLKSGLIKPAKVLQMILRFLYILVFGTGLVLIAMNLWWGSIVKGVLAFWLIYVMEMISTRMSKKELTPWTSFILWIQFFVSFVAVIYFGYFI
ncbi:YisL family protein [Salipaludibacillus aurantiacus]|uniref:Uncharacterized protein n=1 Tax=Salipaludibacillus aurantiacus TaxID=1601833 RepID=A0A1H9T6Z4_9BACI|nr:YisL family protein [Salipaludibacillus aurantiacus]SER93030.1 Protein of unknown function [Salipaludibacillus aurantiacus]